MKKIATFLVVLVMAYASQASAAGKANIPYFHYFNASNNNMVASTLYVTNRSNRDVEITVSLFDVEGDPITKDFIGLEGSNFQSGTNATFTIPAKGMQKIIIGTGTQNSNYYGSGTISWEFANGVDEDGCTPLSAFVAERKKVVGSSGYARTQGNHHVTVNGNYWF